MTLNQMMYFKALAETGHMGQTAEKLYISQPSLSASTARLEKELGVRLFDRQGHRMTLTAEGEAFLRHVKRILREVDESAAHMSRLASSQQTRIRLGCGTPILHDYFPAWMEGFLRRTENRDVRFECSIENTEELVRRLKNGVYDLLLCSRSEDEAIRQVPLVSEPILVVAHQKAPAPPRTWEELARLPLIGYEENSVMDNTLQGIAEDHGTRFQFVYRAPTETAIVALVAHGLGCAVIAWSEGETRGRPVRCYSCGEATYHRQLYLTTLRGQESHGAAGRLIQFLTERSSGAEKL